MIGKIADLILEHVYKMQFVCEDERKSLRLDLYKDAEKLYQQDPISFARGSLLLLNESVPLLETENYRVKMECAQIWHKNSFDIWVFRIRYYLNLDLAINTQLLAQKIKAAFSCYENNFMKRHDASSGYERLFLQILPSNESEDQNLRAALETILTPDLACDVLGVIAYVAIKNQSKDRKDIPAYMKTIYLAVTSFSVIEGGGLCGWVIENKVGSHIDKMLNERLLSILSTKENVNLQTLGFSPEVVKGYQAIVTPIDIAGERLGTLFLYKKDDAFEIDDIILSEYGTTVVGLEMLRSVNEESAEEIRKEQIVQSAISTLSFSELEAILHIFDELEGSEGILVASKIADRVGITRSVIVNALRKFESAGVIESRSSGMKGTYIKVVNDFIFEELANIKKRKSE